MKIVSTSYTKTPEFDNPRDWLRRISFYTGALEELSLQNDVTSIERISYEGHFTQNGVSYYFIHQHPKTVLFPWRTHGLIRKMKPDVVLVNGFIFPLQIIQLRLCLGRNTKIIILHRAERPFKNWKKYFQVAADKCVNAYLFTSSEFGNEWLEQGIIKDRKKIHEVIQASSAFFPKTNSRPAKLSSPASPVFLWVGRLDANKDPLTVIRAFIQFMVFQPEAKLHMIYQADELLNEVQEMIETNNANGSIYLVGYVSHQHMGDWYNGADFIISGSHHEGSGIAICEAMSCGCIPIITDIMSFRRITGPGKCGFLYKAGDDQALLNALLETRHVDLEQERIRVLKQFREELSFAAIARKMHKVIASI